MHPQTEWYRLAHRHLEGRSILILEDEYLIAMDVEQSCLEWGAREVKILRNVADLGERPFAQPDFDAAILDLRLGGETTTSFAFELAQHGIPFVFATGLTDIDEIVAEFPGVPVIGKPYSGDELVRVLAEIIQKSRSSCSA
jgi:DNA-binding response OmpR family regulator